MLTAVSEGHNSMGYRYTGKVVRAGRAAGRAAAQATSGRPAGEVTWTGPHLM